MGSDVAMIMRTGKTLRLIQLQPIFDKLGPEKSKAAIKAHSLTGCNTTGRIYRKSKRNTFKAFLDAAPEIVEAISSLGIGDEPSKDVIEKCQQFLCGLLCKKCNSTINAADLCWNMFEGLGADQGVDKLPPTPGAWRQHILRAHI